jgi:predicted phosphodiesterase
VRLEAALDHLAGSGADLICAVGDIVDGIGNPSRCCRLLAQRDVRAVAGNHERWIRGGVMRNLPDATAWADLDRASREYVAALPRSLHLDTFAGPVLLCHGLGNNDMAGVRPDDFGYALETNGDLTRVIAAGERLVLNGHTHQRMVRRIDTLTIVNAGTLARDANPGFVAIDLVALRVRLFDVSGQGDVTELAAVALPTPQ